MKRYILSGILCLAVSLMITIGSVGFLGPCVHENGSFGTCHWAGQAVFGIGILLSALSLLVVFVNEEEMRFGILLSMLPITVLGFVTPGILIDLCGMASMRCRSVMQPAMRLLFVLLAVIICVAFFAGKNNNKK